MLTCTCDVCKNTIHPCNRIICNKCYSIVNNKSNRFEKKIFDQAQEIARLREKVKELELKLK